MVIVMTYLFTGQLANGFPPRNQSFPCLLSLAPHQGVHSRMVFGRDETSRGFRTSQHCSPKRWRRRGPIEKKGRSSNFHQQRRNLGIGLENTTHVWSGQLVDCELTCVLTSFQSHPLSTGYNPTTICMNQLFLQLS